LEDRPEAESVPLAAVALTGSPQPDRLATRMRNDTVAAPPAPMPGCVHEVPVHVQPDEPEPSPSSVIAAGRASCTLSRCVAAVPGSDTLTATTSTTPRLSGPLTVTPTLSLAATTGPLRPGLDGAVVVGDGAGVGEPVPDGDGCGELLRGPVGAERKTGRCVTGWPGLAGSVGPGELTAKGPVARGEVVCGLESSTVTAMAAATAAAAANWAAARFHGTRCSALVAGESHRDAAAKCPA